jgi:hypothetical protein
MRDITEGMVNALLGEDFTTDRTMRKSVNPFLYQDCIGKVGPEFMFIILHDIEQQILDAPWRR